MNIFSKVKNRVLKTFGSELALLIMSVFIAIIVWFILSMTVYPTIPKTIDDVNLVVDYTNTNSESGLTIISCDIDKVDVRLVGNRAEIGNINADNLVARLDTSAVSTSGTKNLAIKVESVDGVEFEIESITPATATVVFDKIETRTFNISPEIPNISFAEGKTVNRDEIICDPPTINITGPSAQLDKIASCSAVTNKKAVLDTAYSITSDEIKLYTEDKAVFESKDITFENTTVNITIPVLTQKMVDLSFSLLNVPSNFDKDFLDITLSEESISLASANTNVQDFPDTFEVGKISLYDLNIGYSKTFTIDTKDFVNQSNLEAVTVTLNNDDLAKKDIVISEFTISNAPNNYDFEVVTKNLTVTVIGPSDVIENITSSNISADVNLLNYNINSSSFTYDVNISCPTNDNVWAFGISKVTINRYDKTTTTDDDTSSNETTTTTKSKAD